MTYDEETYILNSIKQIRHEVHENNIMLKSIIKYITKEAMNSSAENENDFGRNVLANLISNVFEVRTINKR